MGSDPLLGEMVIGTNMKLAPILILILACSPVFAEIELSGSWVAYLHEDALNRGSGPLPVDYLGLPLNEQGRTRALLYTASQIAMPERQCLYYTSEYLPMGPFGFKMWNETEPINGGPSRGTSAVPMTALP